MVVAPDSTGRHQLRREAMAKGQMRSGKEKKKPKQEKDKKAKGGSAYSQSYNAQPNNNPMGKKG
jgi:hypothetical protein